MTKGPNSILFYSPRCPYCTTCLELLEPYANETSFLGYVNIHTAREHLPSNITHVPTLVLNDGDIVYVGTDVYKWIMNYTNVRSTEVKKQKQQQQPADISRDTKNNGGTMMLSGASSSTGFLDSRSTLLSEGKGMYVGLNESHTTITDSINYMKVRSIEAEQLKTSISPESLQERRNTDLDSMRQKSS